MYSIHYIPRITLYYTRHAVRIAFHIVLWLHILKPTKHIIQTHTYSKFSSISGIIITSPLPNNSKQMQRMSGVYGMKGHQIEMSMPAGTR